MKFPLNKTNGLNFDQYNSIVSYIRDLKPAKYEVVVGHQKRTNPQNRRYWKAIVVCFREWTGYTKNEVHDLLKKKFLSYKEKGKERQSKRVYKINDGINDERICRVLQRM